MGKVVALGTGIAGAKCKSLTHGNFCCDAANRPSTDDIFLRKANNSSKFATAVRLRIKMACHIGTFTRDRFVSGNYFKDIARLAP